MSSPTRRPYTGSCHCGATRYIIFLTLPHAPAPVQPGQQRSPKGVQNFYRCNCTLCHKAGLLHVRPLSPTDDFLLLTPLNPYTEMSDYTVAGLPYPPSHWLFCKGCGMRCVSVRGAGGVATLDVDEAGLGPVADRLREAGLVGPEGKVTAWRPEKPIGEEGAWNGYLSINGYSLDADQEGLDLREWKEKGWVLYLDLLELKGKGCAAEVQYERPQDGGAY